jgi:hypothetical protein
LPDNWPSELNLVLACVRAALFPEKQEPTRSRNRSLDRPRSGPLDWQRFLFWTRRHRIFPLVCAGLKKIPNLQVPDAVSREIHQIAAANSKRMLMLTSELIHLIRELNALGILVIPLKGPALAFQVYGDVTMRQIRDLDLLINLDDLDSAMRRLLSRGYRLHPSYVGFEKLSAKKRALWNDFINHLCLVHPEKGISVELHWNVVQDLLPSRLAEFWERTIRLSFAGAEIPALDIQDLIPLLAAHGAKHAWRRLSWLAEPACLIPRISEEAWETICASVEKSGIRRALVQTVLISSRLFDTPVPERINEWLRKDSASSQLAHYALQQIAQENEVPGHGLPTVRNLFYISRLKSNHAYRSKTLQGIFLCISDFTEIELPDRLLWLYFLLRPIIWVARRWSERAKSVPPPLKPRD